MGHWGIAGEGTAGEGTAGEGTSQQLHRLFPMDALPFSHHARDLDSFDEAVLLEFVQAQKT